MAQAEEAWWALMMDKAAAYQQRRAGLRSQDKPEAATSKPAPPHEGKEPVSKATDPRGPLPADKADAVKQGIQRFGETVPKDTRPVQEGTPRTIPVGETAQPARPQFRVQAPVEREGAIQRIGKKIMDSEIVVTLEDLAAVAPEIQRYVRMKVTPKRVAVNETEVVATSQVAHAEVLKFQIAQPEEAGWNPDLVTAVPALPLRYLDCIIGRFEVEGVLDTGAQMVIISKRLWVELGRPIDANFPRITMQSANATKDRTIGLCANLEVRIYDIPFYLQAHVVEEAPFDLLLGRPFFALAHSHETSLPDGGTVITLKDPNSEVILKVPTKARVHRPPRRKEEHMEAHIDEIEETEDAHF